MVTDAFGLEEDRVHKGDLLLIHWPPRRGTGKVGAVFDNGIAYYSDGTQVIPGQEPVKDEEEEEEEQ